MCKNKVEKQHIFKPCKTAMHCNELNHWGQPNLNGRDIARMRPSQIILSSLIIGNFLRAINRYCHRATHGPHLFSISKTTKWSGISAPNNLSFIFLCQVIWKLIHLIVKTKNTTFSLFQVPLRVLLYISIHIWFQCFVSVLRAPKSTAHNPLRSYAAVRRAVPAVFVPAPQVCYCLRRSCGSFLISFCCGKIMILTFWLLSQIFICRRIWLCTSLCLLLRLP